MNKKLLWMMAAILICGPVVLTSCSNEDNATTDVRPLTEWQAGRTVSTADVEAFGGLDKCFAAEPIPDGVWARARTTSTLR